MNLLDLLGKAGGAGSIDEIAGAVGMNGSDAADVVAALQPALMRAVKNSTTDRGGLAAFQKALETGNHQRYIDDPSLLRETATRDDGNAILGHLFGSKDVSRNVAAQASSQTGIDAALIRKALPLVASIAMGAMSKQSHAGKDINASAGGLGPLAGLLDTDGDGVGLDDVLGLAKRFF